MDQRGFEPRASPLPAGRSTGLNHWPFTVGKDQRRLKKYVFACVKSFIFKEKSPEVMFDDYQQILTDIVQLAYKKTAHRIKEAGNDKQLAHYYVWNTILSNPWVEAQRATWGKGIIDSMIRKVIRKYTPRLAH